MPSIVLACAMALAVGSPHASWQRTDELAAMVRADSNEAQGHYLLGLLFIRREKYDRAEASLRTAIALDSRQAEAHLALAQLPYLQRPQLGSEEARGRVPDAWEARLDEARKFYRRAFVVDPLVSLRSMSMLFPQGRWRGRDYTSAESKAYELFFEGFDDLASGRYRDALERLD